MTMYELPAGKHTYSNGNSVLGLGAPLKLLLVSKKRKEKKKKKNGSGVGKALMLLAISKAEDSIGKTWKSKIDLNRGTAHSKYLLRTCHVMGTSRISNFGWLDPGQTSVTKEEFIDLWR